MAGVNAFRSRNDAEKVKLGLDRKHQAGGSHGPAKLGNLNVREDVEGREVATSAPDPARAPLIKLLFNLAASGDFSLTMLTDTMNAEGLTTRPTPTRPSREVARNTIHRILRDDYYVGLVSRNGVKRPGRHEAIVDQETFDRVQAVLDGHRAAGDRSKKHFHYLSGTVHCRVCGSRLSYGRHRNRWGNYYEYYSCLSRIKPSGSCGSSAAAVDKVEGVVQRLHDHRWLTNEEQQEIRQAVHDFVSAKGELATRQADRHARRLRELKARQEKLVQLYYRDAISVEVLQDEQRRLKEEQAEAGRWQAQSVASADEAMEGLDEALALVSAPGVAYRMAGEGVRKLLNQAIFERVLIWRSGDEVEAEGLPQDVYEALMRTAEVLGLMVSAPPDAVLWASSRGEATAEPSWRAGRPRRGQRINVSSFRRTNPTPVFEGWGSNVSLMAEREGFEPSMDETAHTGFRDRRIQPLCHLSGVAE
jgi:site-specific DNA recombinase